MLRSARRHAISILTFAAALAASIFHGAMLLSLARDALCGFAPPASVATMIVLPSLASMWCAWVALGRLDRRP